MPEFWICSGNNLKITFNLNIQGKLQKITYVRRIYYLKPKSFFQLLRASGKSLRNKEPPTILSSASPWYFLQYHQRYSLQYTSHNSTQTTIPTLAYYPRHSSWHVTDVSIPPMLARHPRYPRQHEQHAISQTHLKQISYSPVKVLIKNYFFNSYNQIFL